MKYTIRDIIKISNDSGSHWFSKPTMSFFNSKIESEVYQGVEGIYFISSEQFVNLDGTKEPRRYAVRQFYPNTGNIKTVGEFNELTKSKAIKLAKEKAKG